MSTPCLVIFGASRGLGRALAWHYAALGWRVLAIGRCFQPSEPAQWPDNIEQIRLDVTDQQALSEFFYTLAQRRELQPIELIVYNVGVYVAARDSQLTVEATQQMLNTNLLAMQQTFAFASQLLLEQGHGQLAATASVAALLKQDPKASVYSASKRSVLSVCDTYRLALAPFGIRVSAIVPGYIDTARLRELNGGSSQHKLFVMSEQAAVQRIVQGLARQQARIIFPRRMRWLIALANCVPAWLLQWR